MTTRLARVGRRKRASVLLLLGVIFTVSGYVMWDTAPDLARSPLAAQAYAAHTDVMPLRAWAGVFVFVGATSAVAAFVPRLPAWVGFSGLQALASFWGLLFIASYAQTGYGRAWVACLQWAAIVGVLVIIADWEDPPPDPAKVEAVLDELGEPHGGLR